MSANLHQKILSGARGIVKLSGEEIGHVTQVNATVNFENIVFVEAGTPIPQAIVPVGQSVEFSCGYVKLIDEDPYGRGFLPRSEAEAIVGWPEMEIEIVDAVTDTAICTIMGAMPSGFNFDFGARTLCAVNQRWQARYVIWPAENK